MVVAHTVIEGDIAVEGGMGIMGGEPPKWNGGVVPYTIHESEFSVEEKDILRGIIRGFNEKLTPDVTLVEYRPPTVPQDYIEFRANPGCWSYVGRVGGKQSINIGCAKTDVGIIEHELLHVLGFWHEQSRPDRDEYIKINYENIVGGMESQFEKRPTMETYGFDYDYNSVMHYRNNAFSKDRGLNTIESINPPGMVLGNKKGMSFTDILELKTAYSGPLITIPTLRPTSGPQINCSRFRRRRGCRRRSEWCMWDKTNRLCKNN